MTMNSPSMASGIDPMTLEPEPLVQPPCGVGGEHGVELQGVEAHGQGLLHRVPDEPLAMKIVP